MNQDENREQDEKRRNLSRTYLLSNLGRIPVRQHLKVGFETGITNSSLVTLLVERLAEEDIVLRDAKGQRQGDGEMSSDEEQKRTRTEQLCIHAT